MGEKVESGREEKRDCKMRRRERFRQVEEELKQKHEQVVYLLPS